MIILSVDYGDMRTGVAVCDRMEILASPVGVVKGDYAPKVAKEINQIAIDKKAELIVVGLPKNMDGSEGERADKCREFASLIEEVSGIKTVMCDERLTTVANSDFARVTYTDAVKELEKNNDNFEFKAYWG